MTDQVLREKLAKVLYGITAFHENKEAGHTVNKEALNYLEAENKLLSILTQYGDTREREGRKSELEHFSELDFPEYGEYSEPQWVWDSIEKGIAKRLAELKEEA